MAAARALALATGLAVCQASTHHIRRIARLQPTATSSDLADDIRNKTVWAFENALSAPRKAAKDVTKQPVGVQIDEKVIAKAQEKMSPQCRKRFNAMMDGTGPRMASFSAHGSPADAPDAAKQCAKLDGKLCVTEARISEQSTHTDGRKLQQEVSVDGNSCVPTECTGRGDLGALAQFMHGQTKEIMPGEDLHVNLHVNCAASGGGDVTVNHKGTLACAAPPLFGTGNGQQACSGAQTLRLSAAGMAVLLVPVLLSA